MSATSSCMAFSFVFAILLSIPALHPTSYLTASTFSILFGSRSNVQIKSLILVGCLLIRRTRAFVTALLSGCTFGSMLMHRATRCCASLTYRCSGSSPACISAASLAVVDIAPDINIAAFRWIEESFAERGLPSLPSSVPLPLGVDCYRG